MLAEQSLTAYPEWIIPPTTAAKLAAEIPVGQRHAVALEIAVSLVGCKMEPTAIFAVLRGKFPLDVPDSELLGIIRWALKANPEGPKSVGGWATDSGQAPPRGEKAAPATLSQPATPNAPGANLEPAALADWWTGGVRLDPEMVKRSSPLALPAADSECANLAFAVLYREGESVNIVTDHRVDGEKARPSSAGSICLRDEWMDSFAQDGVPSSAAGAWLRMNPVAGGVADANVTAFRYLLLESDTLPLAIQLAILSRLRLPVAMIVMSGAASAHAWVHVGAATAERFKTVATRVMAALKPFGIDQANSNASRLSRLPGAVRLIGAVGDGKQELVWLKSGLTELTDAQLQQFEDSLKAPAIDEFPMRAIARRAIDRYDEMRRNQGKLGVPYGVPELDRISGGMKPGQTIVLCGQTGGGKSTVALHTITSALAAGYGVAHFSLESDRDEIFDQLVSNFCSVNRNKFNNGEFSEANIKDITQGMSKIAKLPLYIEDSPSMFVEDIRLKILQLKADGKIGLVVVDYVQFVNTHPVKGESREQQVAAISHALRRIARETMLPMVVVSQLNEEGKMRESRVVAHNANVVMRITVENDNVKLEIVKGRGIPLGTYALSFERMFCRLIPTPIK